MYQLQLLVDDKWQPIKNSYVQDNGDELIELGARIYSNRDWQVVQVVRFSSAPEKESYS